MKQPTEYPLTWPSGIPRTQRPGPSQFKTGLGQARQNVFDSLRRFGEDSNQKITEIVISSDVVGLSGRAPADVGVAVWFIWESEFRCIAVDRYSKVEWNLQAIHHVIEAERTKLRHGGLNIVRATFRAYVALAAPGRRSWRDILGLNGQVLPADIDKRWRELAAKHHPDKKGGSAEMMAEINAARDQALAEVNS